MTRLIHCTACIAGNHALCAGFHRETATLAFKCVCEVCQRQQPTLYETKRIRAGA